DQEGYLALFARYRSGRQLKLKPPQRIFLNEHGLDEHGKALQLSRGRAGKSGRRKIELADWDGDGDLDLITDEDTAVWYENTGSQVAPVLVRRGEIADRKLPGHNPAPSVADWNGDGLPDLIIGAEDGFFYYFDRRYLQAVKASGSPWKASAAGRD
ncbi:MAG: VCBS repeat-containing protein, partial [Acidobacteriia bacterium]|nr:VCBS repeat-containing protein [Terriglobia bacterium]